MNIKEKTLVGITIISLLLVFIGYFLMTFSETSYHYIYRYPIPDITYPYNSIGWFLCVAGIFLLIILSFIGVILIKARRKTDDSASEEKEKVNEKTDDNRIMAILAYIVQLSIYMIAVFLIFNLEFNPYNLYNPLKSFVLIYLILVVILELYFVFGSCLLCEHHFKDSDNKFDFKLKFCRNRPFCLGGSSGSGSSRSGWVHPYLILIYYPVLAGIFGSNFWALFSPSSDNFKPVILLFSIIMITLAVIRFRVLRGWLMFTHYKCSVIDCDIKGSYSQNFDSGYNWIRILVGLWSIFLLFFIVFLIFSNWNLGAVCLSPLSMLAWVLGILTLITWWVNK